MSRAINPTKGVSRALGLWLAAALLILGGCTTPYLVHLAQGQARILLASRPLEEVLADPSLKPALAGKLSLIREVRQFGLQALGLKGDSSFTTYASLQGRPALYLVTAAPKLALKPHTWSFPMVGTFPYKGFFDRRMAEQEVARLEARGLDTYLREAVAYSTLGWFSDPVLEPLLKLNEVLIANIVLHELTHSTVFVTSRMDFNEAVASFVGQQGAVEFFATRDGPGSARHLEALRRAEDERRFGRFLKRVMEELRELYASKLPQEEKLRRRQEVFSRSRRALLAQRPLYHYPDLVDLYTEARLNNAFLLALELYTVDLEIYQAVYERLGRNLARAVALFKEAGRSGKPEAFLSQWLRAEGARAQTG